MAFLKKIFKTEAQKKQEVLAEQELRLENLERQSKLYSGKIAECENKMAIAIKAAQGKAPGSIEYREAERAYKTAKDSKTVLENEYNKIDKAIGTLSRIVIMLRIDGTSSEIDETINASIPNVGKISQLVDNRRDMDEELSELLSEAQNSMADVFKENTTFVSDSVSEFGAALAAEARREDTMKIASAGDIPDSEFASLLNNTGKTQE